MELGVPAPTEPHRSVFLYCHPCLVRLTKLRNSYFIYDGFKLLDYLGYIPEDFMSMLIRSAPECVPDDSIPHRLLSLRTFREFLQKARGAEGEEQMSSIDCV